MTRALSVSLSPSQTHSLALRFSVSRSDYPSLGLSFSLSVALRFSLFPIRLSVSFSVSLSVSLSLYLSNCLSIYRSVFFPLAHCFSLSLSIYPSINFFLALRFSLSLSIYLSVGLSLFLFLCCSPFLFLSVYPTISLFLRRYSFLSFCLSPSIHLSVFFLSLALKGRKVRQVTPPPSLSNYLPYLLRGDLVMIPAAAHRPSLRPLAAQSSHDRPTSRLLNIFVASLNSTTGATTYLRLTLTAFGLVPVYPCVPIPLQQGL